MSTPRIISLFTGAGGLDYGFEAAGFEIAVALDVDPACCATLRGNRPWPVIQRDIADVTTLHILKTGELKRGEADVLVGGPPCQPFSKSGYWATGDAQRMDDPRANTLHAYLRVLEDTQPKTFLLENVPGFAFSGKDEGMLYLLKRIEEINRKTGCHYRPVVQALNAADFGVPQIRERVFVIGCRDGNKFQFPTPRFFPIEKEDLAGTRPYRTAWDALADIEPECEPDLIVTGKWAELLPSIPEGLNYLYHTSRGAGLPLFGWRRRYWTFLLKLAKNRPAWTIQAQPGPATGPFHWRNRRLSMRELCRLQTFPDDVQIVGNLRSAQMQLGNAVPSLLAEILAQEIRVQLLGLSRTRREPQLLPPDRSPAPPPDEPLPAPLVFHDLIGDHLAHPGTGKGFRAQANGRPGA